MSPPMADDAFAALHALDQAARAHAAGEQIASPATPVGGARAVIVRVADHELRIALASIREVKRCPPLAPIPGAQPWLAGATAWQGRAVAVVDLARLAFDVAGEGGESLLICAAADTLVGLRVDAMLDTAASDDDAAEQAHWLGDPDADGRRRLDLPTLLADDLLWQLGRWPRARRRPPAVMLENVDGR